MRRREPHYIIALVGERIEHEDGSLEVGTIVMAERPTEAQAEKECARRNALARANHPSHAGWEYIVMSASEYAVMSRGECSTY